MCFFFVLLLSIAPPEVITNYENIENQISVYPISSTGIVNLAVRTYTSKNVKVRVTTFL